VVLCPGWVFFVLPLSCVSSQAQVPGSPCVAHANRSPTWPCWLGALLPRPADSTRRSFAIVSARLIPGRQRPAFGWASLTDADAAWPRDHLPWHDEAPQAGARLYYLAHRVLPSRVRSFDTRDLLTRRAHPACSRRSRPSRLTAILGPLKLRPAVRLFMAGRRPTP